MPLSYQVTPALHKGKSILVIRFEYTKGDVARFKKLPGARWSATLRSWYLPDTVAYRQRFKVAEKSPAGKAVLLQVREINKPELAKMEQLLILKNYSSSTRKTYLVEFAQLLYVLGNEPVNNFGYERLRKYFAWCFTEKR